MFTNAKKILITTERREVFILRRVGTASVRGFCSECRDEVEWFTFDAAISNSGFGWQELVKRTELGEIHSSQAASGHLLICERSMSSSAGSI